MLTISKVPPGTEVDGKDPFGLERDGYWVSQPWVSEKTPNKFDVVTFQPDHIISPGEYGFVFPGEAKMAGSSISILLHGYADYKMGHLISKFNNGEYAYSVDGMAVTLWRFFPKKKKREYKPSIFAEPLPLP